MTTFIKIWSCFLYADRAVQQDNIIALLYCVYRFITLIIQEVIHYCHIIYMNGLFYTVFMPIDQALIHLSNNIYHRCQPGGFPFEIVTVVRVKKRRPSTAQYIRAYRCRSFVLQYGINLYPLLWRRVKLFIKMVITIKIIVFFGFLVLL